VFASLLAVASVSARVPLGASLALSLSLAASPALAGDDLPGVLPGVIDVGMGTSVIKAEGRPIARVLLSDPDVAEVRLLEEGQYQVRGVEVGNTDLYVWFRGDEGRPKSYKVIVTDDLSDMERRIRETVHNGVPPRVYALRDRIVVEGEVADMDTLERIAAIARVYELDKKPFVNLMTIKGDQQVQLKVVFAELSRTGARELGLNIIGGAGTLFGGFQGPQSTAAMDAALFDPDAIPNVNYGIAASPSAEAFNIVGMITGAVNIGAVLSVLEQYNLAKTLAQPTLVALSGQQAEALVGGEIPIPVSQVGTRITIEYKEYGVKLVFVPTVLGDEVIDCRMYVEVSDIDPNTSTRLSGIEIPGIQSRKAKSQVRIQSGKTFAVAGILDERVEATRAAVPLLGDLPVIGALFRYVKHERKETELVIFVTPSLVRPMSPGEVPAPPGTTEGYNPNDFELFLMGQLLEAGSRTAQPTGAFGMKR
jgi:pilus assembly protein CpaC